MIVLAAEDQQAKQDPYVAEPTVRFPEPVAGRSSTPSTLSTLPDYETSQAQLLLQLSNTPPRRRSFPWPQPSLKSNRWRRALLYGLALYVFLTIVVGVPLIVTQLRRPVHRPRPPPWEDTEETTSLLDLARVGLVLAGDSEGYVCNNWTMSEDANLEKYRASLSHSYSPSGSISLSSNASESNFVGTTGALWVDMNPDTSATDIVLTVDVVASSDYLRHMVHVCFGDSGNDRGAAIYVPSHLSSSDSVDVQIHLLYPTSPSLEIKNLVTALPLYTQTFDNLSPSVAFDTLNVYGSRADIWCDSVRARKISVQTSLGSIGGNFNVTQSLKLDTIEAPITGNLTLTQVCGEEPTTVALYTGNSEINANVTLYAEVSNSNDPPPAYMLDVKTFNDTLLLDIAYDPVTPNARLDLHAQNNLAESTVYLDPKFEGTFDVQTKLSSAEVWEGDTTSAESRHGQEQRTFIYDTRSATRRKGWVGWGSRPADKWRPDQGHIDVVSSYSPVYLRSRAGDP
ncbi:hypothetical protein BD626DRAFT_624788 [Schizophyllum amplum]|uniref:DUF7330 domain-containing protein n=1 Tax=Schizophyllum amplum TaxID=97359 RepID=A0A550CXA6_9AGAR|nr:hypothetical protein BD626DRAFT_624788 [Auriculariopsis ampla]